MKTALATTAALPSVTVTPNAAKATLDAFTSCKGQFIALAYCSYPKPAAAHKLVKLGKFTCGVFRAGIDFAKLNKVKEEQENKERGEVQGLPYGEWKQFPYVITHKGKDQYRLYPSVNHRPNVAYFADKKQVTKEEFASYLTPSAAKKLLTPSDCPPLYCFNVKAENVFFKGSAPQGVKKVLDSVSQALQLEMA
jgi:hypothetical protein